MNDFKWVALASDAGVPSKHPKLVFSEKGYLVATHGRVMHVADAQGLPEGAYDPVTGHYALTHDKLTEKWFVALSTYVRNDCDFDIDLNQLKSSKTFMELRSKEVEIYDGLCPGIGMGLSVLDVNNALKGGKVRRAYQVGPTNPLVIEFEDNNKLAMIMPFTRGIVGRL